jgi:B12-binding domain/radical SAM domain protein
VVTLILNYKKTNTYALNVIAAAISTAPDLADVEIVFARTRAELVKASESATAVGKTALIAWSFYSPSFRETYAELTQLKLLLTADPSPLTPAVINIAGGVHATAEPEQVLRAGFDLAAVGEGEKTIIELLRCLKRGGDVGAVKGIARIVDGQYRANGQGERIELDQFPANAWQHHKFNPIEITRGCIYACKFCQTPFMFKARFRHRSVKNICDAVRVMIERNYKDVRFITPTCLSYGSEDESVHLDRIEELLASVRAIVKDRGRIFFGTFPSEVRPEHVSPEALRLLKRYVAIRCSRSSTQ